MHVPVQLGYFPVSVVVSASPGTRCLFSFLIGRIGVRSEEPRDSAATDVDGHVDRPDRRDADAVALAASRSASPCPDAAGDLFNPLRSIRASTPGRSGAAADLVRRRRQLADRPATGVVGALVGTFLLRAIGFVFSTGLGKEALGLGDADLMMMAGSVPRLAARRRRLFPQRRSRPCCLVSFNVVVQQRQLAAVRPVAGGRRDGDLPGAGTGSAPFVQPLFFCGEPLLWISRLVRGMMFVMSFVLRLCVAEEATTA